MLRNLTTSIKQCGAPNWKFTMSPIRKGNYCLPKTVPIILYIFFWVFPRRQIKFNRRFGTLCPVHLQRLMNIPHQPLKMDLTECSETLAKQSDAGKITKRKYTRFRTRRKFENKNVPIMYKSDFHPAFQVALYT
jgi:hypothetical protein